MTRWTPEHDATARLWLHKGLDYHEIGERLGFSAEYVQEQIEGRNLGCVPRGSRGRRPREDLISEAKRRHEARMARDDRGRETGNLTAEHFGDPPPGCSALDRKRAAEAG